MAESRKGHEKVTEDWKCHGKSAENWKIFFNLLFSLLLEPKIVSAKLHQPKSLRFSVSAIQNSTGFYTDNVTQVGNDIITQLESHMVKY